jgi:hypothetical protein
MPTVFYLLSDSPATYEYSLRQYLDNVIHKHQECGPTVFNTLLVIDHSIVAQLLVKFTSSTNPMSSK